ncbi:hypothetical protein BEL04_10740 [Mucilaginibacter sp. PPCGB 2223]|uniref:hypothetical protein n=1 Tax=Mucilaginibacter sp. PPCGB 2223 TaxID=1886027 RepID=UPI000825E8C8|nr:hypothetical protein [Mucilaginibacter sp. PPCGB 2223]OCX54693.1 hypothetical protein BEL04_10740 [Mucilaginibacter sp. PPCGB 2223]
MKKKLLLILCALPLLSMAGPGPDSTKKARALMPPGTSTITDAFKHHLSMQFEAGTQGVGADLRYGAFKQLSFRLGASFIPVTANNALSLPGFQSTNSINVNFYNAHLLADIVPFKGARGLRLVLGGAYLYKADGGLNVIPTGSYNYNNVTVTGTDIGSLNMNVSWKGVAPYMGLGLFRSFPSHVFNFNLDLGTYYLAQPHTHIIGTGLLSDNYQLEPQFNENLKDYRWLPVLQLNFNFKLK